MTRSPAALILVLAALAQPAFAYEGAGIGREEAPEKAPPPPKLTKNPAVLHLVDAGWPKDVPFGTQPVEVVLIIDIDAAGHVPKVVVSKTGGAPFDAAASAALLASTFTPAEFDGKPSAVRIEFGYHFVPPPPPPPPVVKPKIGNVRGKVLERGSRDPIAGATVTIVQLQRSTDTDPHGSFELDELPIGPFTLAIVAPGHDKLTTLVTIADGKVAEVTAYLWRSVNGQYESTVKGDTQKVEVSQHILEGAELTQVPGTFGDPLRALESMPGVARPSFVSGALLVRGSQPQDSEVMFDGVPIPLLYHFAEGPSVINPSFIDRIDFFPGAYGAEYGRAIAGIVDVKTQPRAAVRLHGKVDINLLDSSFYLEGPAWNPEWGSWAIAGRRSYIDLFLPFVLKAVTKAGNANIVAAPVYWDFQARYDINLGRHHLSFVAFGSNDTLNVEESGATNTQPFSLSMTQGFYRFGLKWSWQSRNGWKLDAAPTIGTTINATDLGSAINISTNSLDLNLRASATKDFVKPFSLKFGIDAFHSGYANTFTTTAAPVPGQPTPAPTVNTSNNVEAAWGTYVQLTWKPIESIAVVPGLRVEVYDLPSGAATSVEPRFNFRWEFHKPFTFKAGWGLYSQAPLPSDLATAGGNPNLGLERSNQTAAGFEWRIIPPLLLDVQGFFNLRQNLVVDTSSLITQNGQITPQNKNNSGYGRAYGLEVLLKHEITRQLFGWIAYTLSRSEQWDPNTNSYQPISTDQTHILSAVASYHFNAQWELGARLQYTSGEPITPVLGGVLNADTGAYSPIYGPVYSARGPYFLQLDMRLDHYWVFETWRMSLYLDIQNITNSPNPQLSIYDYNYQQSATINGLPFLPYIGLQGSF